MLYQSNSHNDTFRHSGSIIIVVVVIVQVHFSTHSEIYVMGDNVQESGLLLAVEFHSIDLVRLARTDIDNRKVTYNDTHGKDLVCTLDVFELFGNMTQVLV